MAAAHNTPTAFATATFRSRKRPSGISGASTRASIAMNTAKSTAPAARNPSVWAESQPSWLPLTIAYTASISAAVTVTAPATSRRPETASPRPEGTSFRVSTRTRIPTGTLTRKIQCQLSTSVRMPPRRTPSEPPPEATKPKIPMAFARSAGSVKSVIISERATAETTAAPRPCTARPVTRRACEVASPQPSEARVKSEIPARKRRRCPKRSPSLPPSRRKPPNVSR